MKILKVMKNHKSEFQVPLVAMKGDVVEGLERETEWEGWLWCVNREGKNGWVPEHYVSRNQNVCTLTVDYDATELTVEEGETLEIHKREAGWWWCVNRAGLAGWVPEENLEIEEN